jgi:hypothetical protein
LAPVLPFLGKLSSEQRGIKPRIFIHFPSKMKLQIISSVLFISTQCYAFPLSVNDDVQLSKRHPALGQIARLKEYDALELEESEADRAAAALTAKTDKSNAADALALQDGRNLANSRASSAAFVRDSKEYQATSKADHSATMKKYNDILKRKKVRAAKKNDPEPSASMEPTLLTEAPGPDDDPDSSSLQPPARKLVVV